MNPFVARVSRLFLILGFLVAACPSRGQNLVADPGFATGLGPWLSLSTGVPPATLVRDPGAGVDGAAGFATLTAGSFGPITYVARACVPAQPGVTYSFGGDVRFRALQNSSAVFWLRFYSDSACTTAIPSPPLPPTSTGADGSSTGWTLCRGTGALAPPGAASTSLDFVLFGISASERASADLDSVYVGRAGTVEPPFPVPSLARPGVLALGAALALAGILGVRSK